MKKLFFAFTVIAVHLLFSSQISFSQSETTMQDILETVKTKVAQLENEKKQEVVNVTIDLLVNQGKKTITRVLDPNYEYTIIAIGDRRISKLKISAYSQGASRNEFVDDASGLLPAMKITPDGFDIYLFTVSAEGFDDNNNAGHFALIIYHDEDTKIK